MLGVVNSRVDKVRPCSLLVLFLPRPACAPNNGNSPNPKKAAESRELERGLSKSLHTTPFLLPWAIL